MRGWLAARINQGTALVNWGVQISPTRPKACTVSQLDMLAGVVSALVESSTCWPGEATRTCGRSARGDQARPAPPKCGSLCGRAHLSAARPGGRGAWCVARCIATITVENRARLCCQRAAANLDRAGCTGNPYPRTLYVLHVPKYVNVSRAVGQHLYVRGQEHPELRMHLYVLQICVRCICSSYVSTARAPYICSLGGVPICDHCM